MIQPLHDYVLLKKEQEEKTTASGIILTSGKEKSKFATVEAIGTGVEKADYKAGDKGYTLWQKKYVFQKMHVSQC